MKQEKTCEICNKSNEFVRYESLTDNYICILCLLEYKLKEYLNIKFDTVEVV